MMDWLPGVRRVAGLRGGHPAILSLLALRDHVIAPILTEVRGPRMWLDRLSAIT
jgi:hypothetical protein